ncbi:hypothetical protein NLU13_3406 [Sarocladium strictum]|uniref:Uncharacterized protein n=1 Tax=Sarocladium strictum TaxID=5046 RepID=A0AA39GND5_SARSR|nr:hypothetical protein NLU13_3406 [Sarocladium strictum]
MLSHLRFHRRGPASTPSSPVPDQQPPSPFTNQAPILSTDPSSPYVVAPSPVSSAALPPILPPITRVTSTESEPQHEHGLMPDMMSYSDQRPEPPSKQQSNVSGFIGGLALQNYRKGINHQTQQRPETADGSTSAGSDARATHANLQGSVSNRPEAPTRPSPVPTTQPKSASSFTTPTELQTFSVPSTGRRPTGTRLASEPVTMAASTEPQRGKKSLPFLKNSMSTLLMRRKNSHNVPDLLPLPLKKEEEPAYDPRIKGTRVHDFSAPRRKHHMPHSGAHSSRSPTRHDRRSGMKRDPSLAADSMSTLVQPTSYVSSASESASASVISQPVGHSTSASSQKTKASAELVAAADQEAPPVPPKDDADVVRAHQSRRSHVVHQDGPSHAKSVASKHSAQSRKVSLADRTHRETISSIPKHMKSTSSRFSFDMIGAAKQEKLLEERHRQRELERQTTEPADSRDSHYDDFDEDAMYEAMMDDGGYEEEIPGVSFDYEEDDFITPEDDMEGNPEDEPEPAEDDPDNDQENFEGFVFQRSNPASTLTSPQYAGTLPTPRDASGEVIGAAMTKFTPNLQIPTLSPLSPFSPDFAGVSGSRMSGLGIQCISTSPLPDADVLTPQLDVPVSALNASAQIQERDELDFGSGVMSGFENEFAEDLAADPDHDAAPFDESIFDNNDTDQYGRPVPGAFAQAQSMRHAAKQGSVKRESDMTSRFSAQSAITGSTAHTSLSADNQNLKQEQEPAKLPHSTSSSTVEPQEDCEGTAADPMAAYQAALAAAACEAAASGKFERDDSSPNKEDASLLSEELDDERAFDPSAYEDDEDDMHTSHNGLDDYELDDEAIIAEANADMLAYDEDYYGQEFGFYSTPVTHHGSVNSRSSDDSEYSFAGGFFAPKGVDIVNRSKSGRVVSREPNLTPITERSEYSNRNSVMSFAGPPFMSGTPIQSPGLAQLAMMADRGDDQMSLTALMRLRSKAWGGSQISLSSSREGSPRSERGDLTSPLGGQSGSFFPAPNPGHLRKSSVYSTLSRDSEANSMAGSPTLTGMDFSGFSSPLAPSSQIPPIPTFHDESADVVSPLGIRASLGSTANAIESIETPVSASSSNDWNWGKQPQAQAGARRTGFGHRHKGSADSISYIQEEEEGGGETRWVMERRRTGESGQIEVLEREIVEGGRI